MDTKISNVYASAIIGQHHKRVGATVTANDNRKYYEQKNSGEGIV